MAVTLTDVRHESWPIAGSFTISRGSKTAADVVVATVTDGTDIGRGEAVPYTRYGETLAGVMENIREAGSRILPLTRQQLLTAMPAGAARNAIDCALIDLEAKSSGRTPAEILAVPHRSTAATTCYTLSLDTPDAMARAATAARDKPILKLKLGGGETDAERLRAIRAARPEASLLVDANEAWSENDLPRLLDACAAAAVGLVEQPLPAGHDQALAHIRRPVPVCADESAHTAADIPRLIGLYDAINIKLDKAGGLTAALAMAEAASRAGLRIMVGCMVSTSLAMAPAWLLAGHADWLDLDGPLLLARDREGGIVYGPGAAMAPPSPRLWG
jgi:L-alanine-DL-glutamate epimerase-like enolase superfamily enzyme